MFCNWSNNAKYSVLPENADLIPGANAALKTVEVKIQTGHWSLSLDAENFTLTFLWRTIMANGVNSPFGLKPVITSSASAGNGGSGFVCTIASAYATTIVPGDPVTLSGTAGVNGPGIVRGVAAGPYFGVFGGVLQYTPAVQSYFSQSQSWVAGTVLAAGTECVCLVYTDLDIIYQVQVGGGTNQLVAADVGNNAQMVIADGSASTGTSACYLDQTTIANTATHPLKIVGLLNAPGNAFGVNYNIALVTMNQSVMRAGTAGI